jgi:hypothetical protein
VVRGRRLPGRRQVRDEERLPGGSKRHMRLSALLPKAHIKTTLDHRHCLPVRLRCAGCSFQFGRTSMRLLPHPLQTTRGPNGGTAVSAG